MKQRFLLFLVAASMLMTAGCYTKTVFVPVDGRGRMERAYDVDLYRNRITPALGSISVPVDPGR